MLTNILETSIKYRERRENSKKSLNSKKEAAFHKKVLDFVESSRVNISKLNVRAICKKFPELLDNVYVALILEASSYGDMDLSLKIYEQLLETPKNQLLHARTHACCIIINDLLCCSSFREIQSYLRDFKVFTKKSGLIELMFMTSGEIIRAINDAKEIADSSELKFLTDLALDVYKAGREFFKEESDYKIQVLFADSTYFLILALKTAERFKEALDVIKDDVEFTDYDGQQLRFMGVFAILSHFLMAENQSGYKFLANYLNDKRYDTPLSMRKGNAAILYVRECIKDKNYTEAKIIYEFFSQVLIRDVSREYKVFIPYIFIIAEELMNALLNDDEYEAAWEIFLSLPDEKISGKLYEDLFNAAMLFIFHFGERGEKDFVRKVTETFNRMASSQDDAKNFAEALYHEMSVCRREGLPFATQLFYDAFLPYDNSLAIKNIRNRMTNVMIKCYCEYGKIDKALEYYQALPPPKGKDREAILKAKLYSEIKITEAYLKNGELGKGEDFLREHLNMEFNLIVSHKWYSLVKNFVENFAVYGDFNSMEELFGFFREKLPKDKPSDFKMIFRVARIIIMELLNKGHYKRAITFFEKLPDTFNFPRAEKFRRGILFGMLGELCQHNRIKDALKLYFKAYDPPEKSEYRRFPANDAKAGAMIVEEIAYKGHLEEAGKVYDSLVLLKGTKNINKIRGKAAVHFIRACIKLEKADKALELFKTLPEICNPLILKKSLNKLAQALSLLFSKNNDNEKDMELQAFMRTHDLTI